MTGFGGNRSIVIGLHLDPRGVRAGLAVARREMTDFARAGAEASRKHKRAYDDVANGIGAAGLALGAFAAVAVVSFARFDKAMSRAGAGTQATASQMTALRAAAIKAGADTAFSATQAADAITEMGKAGVSVQDILGGGLKGTLALAAAGELEVARASEIAATTMTQFGLTGKDVGHVADVLAAGAGKAQGSVEDLAQGLKFVGPVAAQAGITLEQTTGVLAEFASQGIIGEQAGTTFRSVLASLTAPSKLAAKEMDRLGISMYDTNGRFIGMEGAAQELQEKLGSLSAAQRNAALEIIFGREAMTGATVLYKGGAAAVRDWTDKVNDQGFAAEQAGKLMDNLAGDVEKLKGSLETAFISSGSGANDGLRAIVSTVDGAVDAFNGLPGPVQKSTVVIAAVGGAALIATAGLLKLVGAAAAAKVNLAALGVSAATTKASLVAVGKVGAAAAGLYALGQAADEINSSVGDSAVTVADLSKALEELGKRGQSEIQVGKFGKGFEDIGKQLKELSQADLLDRFNDAQASFLNFIQLRDLPEGRQNRGKILEDFRRLDAELTRMVNSGNLEGAQEQFGLLNQKAIAGGAGVNQLARHLPQYEAAVAQAGQTTEDAAGAADGYTASQRGALAASKALEAGQEGLKTALDAASNAFLVGRSASRDYQAAIDAAKESAKTNGETLDENTEKGRANAASLDALATSSLAYLGTLTGPNGEATPKFNRALEDSRVRLIAAARGFGMGEAAAKAYAAKILDVPAEAVTRVTLLNARNAIAQITTLRENLGRIPGSKTVFFRVEGLRGLQSAAANARDIASADGNIIRYYGSGGVENHVAQIARPKNTVRIWAEPETGGEAYIPLAPSKRQRSKAILKQTAGILGMQAFAAGGFSSPFGASDVQQRYTALLPQPITPQQYAAAMKAAADAQGRTANAADRLRAAERDLTRTRRDSPRDAGKIRDAEDDLNKARRAHAAARRAESAAEAKAADATRRKNAGRGFNLGLYINALGQTTRQAESYRRNLSAVSRRGGSDLAAALEAMGADGAPLIAALVRASPAQFKRVANLLRRLDPSAFGGGQKVTRFAAGGIAPATMGGWRVFGEAGSDEAFIPLDRSKQARSRMLTADVAGRLGGQVTWSTHRVIPGATGVSAAPSSSVASGAGVSMNVGTVQLLRGGPEDVANDVMFRVRQLGG